MMMMQQHHGIIAESIAFIAGDIEKYFHKNLFFPSLFTDETNQNNQNPNRANTAEDIGQDIFLLYIKTFFIKNALQASKTYPSLRITSATPTFNQERPFVQNIIKVQPDIDTEQQESSKTTENNNNINSNTNTSTSNSDNSATISEQAVIDKDTAIEIETSTQTAITNNGENFAPFSSTDSSNNQNPTPPRNKQDISTTTDFLNADNFEITVESATPSTLTLENLLSDGVDYSLFEGSGELREVLESFKEFDQIEQTTALIQEVEGSGQGQVEVLEPSESNSIEFLSSNKTKSGSDENIKDSEVSEASEASGDFIANLLENFPTLQPQQTTEFTTDLVDFTQLYTSTLATLQEPFEGSADFDDNFEGSGIVFQNLNSTTESPFTSVPGNVTFLTDFTSGFEGNFPAEKTDFNISVETTAISVSHRQGVNITNILDQSEPTTSPVLEIDTTLTLKAEDTTVQIEEITTTNGSNLNPINDNKTNNNSDPSLADLEMEDNTASIIGATVGGIVVIVLIVAFVLYYFYKIRKGRQYAGEYSPKNVEGKNATGKDYLVTVIRPPPMEVLI